MQSALITAPGGPDVLVIRDTPRPVPGPWEVLVRVHASALNRADLMQREGRYPAPPGVPADIPGMEFAGEVTEVGEHAALWRPGDRVYGLVGGGAQAEYLVTHERLLAAIPSNLGWGEAAACPEACITAHDALVTQAGVRPGETVLIPAVASGVGLAAVQIARALGALVYGTTRTAAKLELARPFGLVDGACLTSDGGGAAFGEQARVWTGGRGMDVILDLVGGAYTASGVLALAPRGRLILIGTMAGIEATLSLRHILSRRLTVRGTALRSRALEEKILATRLFAAEIGPMLADGRVAPVIDARFPLAAIADAHRHLASNETFGKVVIDIAP
jgi:putative PIG3 family NAD(P)H quinone oxidoreductase